MKISRVPLPAESLLSKPERPYDYADSYASPVRGGLSAAEAAWDFFGRAPQWVSWLMQIRNRVVSLFGLKTGSAGSPSRPEKKDLVPGKKVGMFQIYSVSETEVILGEDDRHLNFRVSVLLSPLKDQPSADPLRMLTVSTVVHYQNTLGRIYFFFVRPVHQIIVPAMFRRMLSSL